MRLLVITAFRERAEEIFGDLEQMDVSVAYLEVGQADWAGRLPDLLAGRAGTADGVLLFFAAEEPAGEIVRSIRNVLSVPLAVYSGRPSYYQELQCLQAGADDYQSDGCRLPVLRQRLLNLVQLYRGNSSGLLPHGCLREDMDAKQFYFEEASLRLTGKEYQVLHWLVHSREEIVPKGKLLYHIWEQDDPKTSRALDTVIKQLRRKLEGTPVSIKTCYGRGYCLNL